MNYIEDTQEKTIPIVLGITGHRDLQPEDLPMLREKLGGIFEELKSSYQHTPFIILSPLAEGADRLAAQTAMQHGITLQVPLPLPIEEYVKDFASEESVKEFFDLLQKAERYYVEPKVEQLLSEGTYHFSEYRTVYYEYVGMHIARYSQILIALWNGLNSNSIGGTAQIVHYKLNGLPARFSCNNDLLVPPDTGTVFHIVTPRASNPNIEGNPFELKKYFSGR